jgi:hypothetical protein
MSLLVERCTYISKGTEDIYLSKIVKLSTVPFTPIDPDFI